MQFMDTEFIEDGRALAAAALADLADAAMKGNEKMRPPICMVSRTERLSDKVTTKVSIYFVDLGHQQRLLLAQWAWFYVGSDYQETDRSVYRAVPIRGESHDPPIVKKSFELFEERERELREWVVKDSEGAIKDHLEETARKAAKKETSATEEAP